VDQRIIDLSYAAAIKLDMTRKGTAKVKLEALSVADPALAGEVIPPPVLHEEPPSMVSSGQARMYVQVGAFGDPDNAAKLRRDLDRHGFQTVVRNSVEEGRRIYRVRIGPLKDDVSFDSTMSRLKELEYPGAYLALE
jgi:rare lipoprotein A